MRSKLLLTVLLLFVLVACGSQSPTAQKPHPSSARSSSGSLASVCTSSTWAPTLSHEDGANTSRSTASVVPPPMKMGPHMKMTGFRAATQADYNRAMGIMEVAKLCLAKYKDYHLALRDGYQIFTPDVPQDIYHFASVQNFFAAQSRFDPRHPSALLYRPVGSGYQLVGVMFSAPANFSEDQLNQLFPLGIAPWHLHTNICLPQGDMDRALFPAGSQFGLEGSITTEAACTKASGTFFPQMFGWMVHIYPWGNQYSS
jgi:hypothetical protein